MVSKILCILWNEGCGACPRGTPWVPRSMSLNVPYHKEQEYIWFREGILNPKQVIMHFHFFPYKCLCYQIWPWPKIGQGHPRVTIMQFMMGPRPRCYIPSSCKSAQRFRRRRFLKSFYHILAWQPSLSCDLDHPGVPRSMSLNAPYLKEQEYIWFMGEDLNGFQDIMHFMKWRGWGMPPGDPLRSQDPSLNVPYPKKQEYIWFREGILNPKFVIMHFHFFPYKCLCNQIWPWPKMPSQGHNLCNLWWAHVPDATYQVSCKSAQRFRRRRFLKGFYHIRAWRPSWSCDLDPICKLSFPHPMEAPHEIWLQSAQWFQRRRCLKMWTHDTHRQQPCHTISSPMSLRLRWAKKLKNLLHSWELSFLKIGWSYHSLLIWPYYKVCIVELYTIYNTNLWCLNLTGLFTWKRTRAGVCKTLCPQLPDSNTVWLQHCLAMTVTTVQIYDFNVILSKGNNSKIGDDWDKKKIRITYFFKRNQNMKFQNISIHGSKLMLYTIKQRH